MLGENEQIDPEDLERAALPRCFTYYNDNNDSGVK